MEVVWFGLAIICGIIWAWMAITQKITGDKHQKAAREYAAAGDWAQASLSYKLALISRLDSHNKIEELVGELAQLYQSIGKQVDMSRLYECPEIIKTLGAGTGNQRKKNELMVKLYADTQNFLDSLPGPPIPD